MFLGVRITQAQETITLDQRTYCGAILTRYSQYIGMRNYTDVPLARDAHTIYMQQELSSKQQRFCSGYPYTEIVGALMYRCVLTRPDIAYAVGTLTRHMANPTYAACKACSRVLNYLHTFPGLGIRFQAGPLQLHAYTDSDWAACLRTRRSVSGNVVLMAGGPVA